MWGPYLHELVMPGGVEVVLEVPFLKAHCLVARDLPQLLQLGQNLLPLQVLQLLEFFLLFRFLLWVAGKREGGYGLSPQLRALLNPPPPHTHPPLPLPNLFPFLLPSLVLAAHRGRNAPRVGLDLWDRDDSGLSGPEPNEPAPASQALALPTTAESGSSKRKLYLCSKSSCFFRNSSPSSEESSMESWTGGPGTLRGRIEGGWVSRAPVYQPC